MGELEGFRRFTNNVGSNMMPRLPIQTVASEFDGSGASQDLAEKYTRDAFRTRFDENVGEGLSTRIAKYAASSGIDLVDQVGSLLPGVDRGDIWKSANDAGMTGLADWAERNRSGVEFGSGIVSTIATGYLAEVYLLPKLIQGLAKSSAISNSALWKSGTSMIPLARQAALRDTYAAAKNMKAVSLRAPGAKALLASTAAREAGRAAFAESAIAFVTQNNDAMWSNDMGENLAMYGLGIVAGGLIGGIQGRAELRHMANRPGVLNTRLKASDPSGWRTIRDMNVSQTLAAIVSKGRIAKTPMFSWSADVTIQALEAYSTKAVADVPGLTGIQSKLGAINKETKASLEMSLAKFANEGIEGVAQTSIKLGDPENIPIKRILMEGLENDPTLFLGMQSIGKGNPMDVLKARSEHIKALAANPDTVQIAKALRRQTPWALVDGHWMPVNQNVASIASFEPAKIRLESNTGKGLTGQFMFKMKMPTSGHVIKLDSTGKVLDSKGVSGWKSGWDFSDKLGVYEGLRKLSQNLRKPGQAKSPKTTVDFNSDWLHLDWAAYHASKGGNLELGGKTLDDVKFESLKKKAELVRTEYPNGLSYWDRFELNLPLPTSMERVHDGTATALRTVLDSVRSGKVTSIKEANELWDSLLTRSELASDVRGREPFTLEGNIFEFNRNKDNAESWKPVLTGFEDVSQVDRRFRGTREHVIEDVAINKMAVMQDLMSNDPDSITNAMTQLIATTPVGQALTKIGKLADDQMTGVGGQIQSEIGGFLGKSFRARDSILMTTSTVFEKMRAAISDRIIKSNLDVMADVNVRINASTAVPSKQLRNQFLSMRPGWDLKPGGKRPAANGQGWEFELKPDSEVNKAWFKAMGIQSSDVLLNHVTGKPIILDDLSMEWMERFSKIAKSRLDDSNRIRMANRQEPLENIYLYAPPKDTRGKIVGFTMNVRTGKPVPGKAVVASTQEEFDRLKKEVESKLAGIPDEQFYTQTQLEATGDLWDHASLDFHDPSISVRLKNKSTGALTSQFIDQNAGDNALHWVKRQVESQAKDTTRLMLAEQIRQAKQMQQVAKVTGAAPRRIGETPLTRRTIWDEFLQTTMGAEYAKADKLVVTQTMERLEGLAQKLIDAGWQSMRHITPTEFSMRVTQLANMAGLKLQPKHVKDYDSLVKALGPHTPYASVQKYVTDVVQAGSPPEVAKIAEKLNQFSAAMLLRWVELPNAAMNLLGLVTNFPSILGNSRTPVMGQVVTKGGAKIGIVDGYRIMARAMRDMFDAKSAVHWDYMKANGMDQGSMAEFMKSMSLMDSQTGFNRVMMGDATKHGAKPMTKDWVKHKGIDGMLSLATDGTESFARQYSHFVGLEVARLNGITKLDDMHQFANALADSAVANYSPFNRGEVFNTSIGSMYGLFTTYMMAYNTRLFRWLETGNYSAVARQLGTQVSLFGVESAPGYELLESVKAFMDGPGDSDPEMTLTDKIYASYGPMVGSAIAHGGVSMIPKIFGAPTGIALYTRGDAGIRAPSGDPRQALVALGVMSRIGNGLLEVGSAVMRGMGDETVETQALVSEALARAIPNRMIKGFYSVMANDGVEVDSYGQVMAASQGTFESIVRSFGVRTTRQQDELNFYYTNKSMQDRMAGRMEQLRESTRAAIRKGNFNNIPKLFERYQELGGNPEHFKRWYQDNVTAATESRGLRQLHKSINDPSKYPFAARQSWVQ